MFDHKTTNTHKRDLGPGKAQNFDSVELQNDFLSAIGFLGATNEGTPKNPKTVPGPQFVSQQASSSTNINQPSSNGVRPRKMPSNPYQNPQAQKGANQTPSSPWTRNANQPNLSATSYWEAERIKMGILDPSTYPKPWNPTTRNPETQWFDQTLDAGTCGTNNPDNSQQGSGSRGRTAKSWRARAPRAVKNTATSQSHGPNTSSNAWIQYNEVPPTYRPSDRQLYVPGRLGQGVRNPRAQGQRNGPAKQHRDGTRPLNNGMGPRKQPLPSPSRLGEVSPDLVAYRVPRPDMSYAGSKRSMPSWGSGVNISDSGIGEYTDKSGTDIRNSIGLKHNIQKSRGTWTIYNWANPTGRDYDEVFWNNSYLASFIGAWAEGVSSDVQASFNDVDEHWKCDVDTSTGDLLQPIVQPETMTDHASIDPASEWRRQNWTSALLMRRRTQQRFGNSRRRKPPSCVEDEGPPVMDERFITKVEEYVLETPEYHHYVPRIPCFLRPAEKYDMESVRLIYNWEVEHGLQALDSQPLLVEDFEKILSTSQQLGMPFIVAARGSAKDLGLTNGNLVFSTFHQVPFNEKDKRGEVLGFAFLSVWQPGLAGSGIGSSRATAKINVFVHPDYRRKKIGFSLLDMLLTAVSDRFSSQSGYDFIDADDSPVYKNTPSRERQYFHLYVSFLVKHKHRTDGNKQLENEQKTYDNDLAWVKPLLEDRLNFTEVARFEAVHRSPKGRGGPACWLDEVVFEHTCHFDPLGIKEDY